MNAEQPLVTAIVPVYGVERYLDRCVRSLVGQTHRNLEIILVDDGSLDASPAICDRWAARDARVRVIHQTNAGVSAARNRGMEVARGTYLCFVDADDYAEPDMVATMVARAEADDAQMVWCGYETNMMRDDGPCPRMDATVSYDLTLTDNAGLAAWFAELAARRYVYPSWNKLFRADFVRAVGARFPVGVIADEDSYFGFPLYAAVERVSVVPARLYHYVVRPGSAAGRYQPALFASRRTVWRFVSPIVARWNPSFAPVFDNLFLSGVGLCLNFLYEDRTLGCGERRAQVAAIARDEAVRDVVGRVRPVGLRNRLAALCLRGGPAMCRVYGASVAMAKRLCAAVRLR